MVPEKTTGATVASVDSNKPTPEMLLFSHKSYTGFNLTDLGRKNQKIIDDFQRAAYAQQYSPDQQAAILISANFGIAESKDDGESLDFTNPFSPTKAPWTSESSAAIDVIIPAIIQKRSNDWIECHLTLAGYYGDSQVPLDGSKPETTPSPPSLIDVTETPPPMPQQLLDLAGKKYEWNHAEMVLEKFHTCNWPNPQTSILTFGDSVRDAFKGENESTVLACAQFMSDYSDDTKYKDLQDKYKVYRMKVEKFQSSNNSNSLYRVVYECSPEPLERFYSRSQYKEATRNKFVEVIKNGNAINPPGKNGKFSQLSLSSINDFQRFAFISDRGKNKHNLINKACDILTHYTYFDKTEVTDPSYMRGLNIVQPQLHDSRAQMNWILKSKHGISQYRMHISYRTLYPFGRDPSDEIFTGNHLFKMNYQPTCQVDCPKVLMNLSPALGGPPIDYLLKSCTMSEIWAERDGTNCNIILNDGDRVIIWGEDAHRVRGDTIFNGVWAMDSSLKLLRRVGVVKFLPHQCQYFQNRIGSVTNIEFPADITYFAKPYNPGSNDSLNLLSDAALGSEVSHTINTRLSGSKRKAETSIVHDTQSKKYRQNKPKSPQDESEVEAMRGKATIKFTDGLVVPDRSEVISGKRKDESK